MSAGPKAALLAVGAYVATLAVAAVLSVVIMIALSPHGCSAYSRALLVLWIAIAGAFLLSVGVVGVVGWRLLTAIGPRLALVGVYGAALLATYIVIAFSLMVAFNC